MKLVSIELKPAAPDDRVRGVAVVQKRRGDRWEVLETYQLRDGTGRTLLLEDDERLIVEGASNRVAIMGSQNNVVYKHVEDDGRDVGFSELAAAPGPLPDGDECQVGVWREAGEKDWSRTGKRYRTY